MIGLTLFRQTPPAGVLTFVGFHHYLQLLGDEFYLVDVFWLTLRLSLISTFLAVAFGVPLAYAIARATRFLSLWMCVVLLPLWVNVVIRLLGWMILLADRGPVNEWLMAAGVIDSPVRLIFNELGVVIGLTQITVPFVVLPMIGVIRQIPMELEQVAWTLGGGRAYVFWRIVLPLSLPGIAAGSLLAFALNATSFVIPSLLGGGHVRMAAMMAYEHSMVYGNLPVAGTIGVVLLALTLVTVFAYARLLARGGARVSAL